VSLLDGLCVFNRSANTVYRYQEDAHSISAVKLSSSMLKRAAERDEHHWDPPASDEFASQVLFAAVYDGS
jgi:hypothetical protein